ncbi:MAG: DMT family transporter [Alphaproteobacteria bacterium]|nr:DMT family transporter [Alphaproteobacteria bacterium]
MAGTSNLKGWRLAYAIAVLVFTGASWGVSYSIAKIATEAGFDPFGMTLWQGLGGGLLLLALCAVRGSLPPVSLRHLRFYLLCGTLGTAVPSFIWFWIAPKLPSGLVAITGSLVPLMTLSLALVFRVEGFEPKRALGILLGFGAVLLIVVPEPGMAGWFLVSLVIPLCYASENLAITLMRPPRIDSAAVLCGMLLAGAGLALVPVVATGGWVDLSPPWGEAEWLLVLLVLINVLSYFSFIELIRVAGPVFAAQQGYITTVSGILWGIAIFSERHSGWVWIAVAVMFSGLALVSPRGRRQPT